MKLEARRAELRDVPELKRMIDTCLAPDYYTPEKLEACSQIGRRILYH